MAQVIKMISSPMVWEEGNGGCHLDTHIQTQKALTLNGSVKLARDPQAIWNVTPLVKGFAWDGDLWRTSHLIISMQQLRWMTERYYTMRREKDEEGVRTEEKQSTEREKQSSLEKQCWVATNH